MNLDSAEAKFGYVYFIHAEGTNRYKIGYTNNLDRRIKELSGGQAAFVNQMLWSIRVCDMRTVEGILHQMFSDRRVNGEWFEFDRDELYRVKSAYGDLQSKYPVDLYPRKLHHLGESRQSQQSLQRYDDDEAEYDWGAIVKVAAVGALFLGAWLVNLFANNLPAEAVSSQRANVRETPNGKIICTIAKSTQIKISAQPDSGGWYSTNACQQIRGLIHQSVISKKGGDR